jgi:predicted DNA-binding transcriptional regulator AlpA
MEEAQRAQLQREASAAAFIPIAEVKRISGFSKSTILRMIKRRAFPEPVITEPVNCRRWDLAEVMAWRAEQFKKRELRRTESEQPEAMA